MKFFRTEDVISFHYGAILGLNEKQSKPRILTKNLKDLMDGKFEVIGEIQFKKGEIIGLEEKDIGKAFLSKLTLMTDEKPESELTPVVDEVLNKKEKTRGRPKRFGLI